MHASVVFQAKMKYSGEVLFTTYIAGAQMSSSDQKLFVWDCAPDIFDF
ncbi:MAG: hypothetical protein JWP81_4851 [Ferruginibacter sp.]|nr:hypothetical protein [Ferruginibacter sp.]